MSLLDLRSATGKTRREVARDLHLNEKTLWRLETGRGRIKHVVAVAFADYYGVDVGQITNGRKESA